MSINSRAQVPGYSGYIPGKISANRFGATFAQISSGAYPDHPQSFMTTNIANNSFIKQQHANEDNAFWSDSGKVDGFQRHSKQPEIRIQRTPVTSIYVYIRRVCAAAGDHPHL
jgi:hypothetical protein